MSLTKYNKDDLALLKNQLYEERELQKERKPLPKAKIKIEDHGERSLRHMYVECPSCGCMLLLASGYLHLFEGEVNRVEECPVCKKEIMV